MTLTSHGVEPFRISTFVWNDALDLASGYGWDRTVKEADFGPGDKRTDEFRYGWYQHMAAEDVKELAAALRELLSDEDENDEAPHSFAELAAFLESCEAEVRLEQ